MTDLTAEAGVTDVASSIEATDSSVAGCVAGCVAAVVVEMILVSRRHLNSEMVWKSGKVMQRVTCVAESAAAAH